MFKRVGDDAFPPKHARYVVKRGHVVFTATPCYGLHRPWWVQKMADGTEAEPIVIEADDLWMPLPAFAELTGGGHAEA